MINGFRIYDFDAHVNVAPQMWKDLPKDISESPETEYFVR